MAPKQKLFILSLIVSATTASSFLVVIPFGYSYIFPIQHFSSVLVAILLGPWYALGVAFVISILRFALGLGTLFAFSGSMFGAVLAGLLYAKTKKLAFAAIGEVVGTGIIGAFVSYLIAVSLTNGEATIGYFFPAYLLSSLAGAVMAYLMFKFLAKNKMMENL